MENQATLQFSGIPKNGYDIQTFFRQEMSLNNGHFIENTCNMEMLCGKFSFSHVKLNY